MSAKASIQQGVDGEFVHRRVESKKSDIFRQGAFEAKLATDAPEAVQKKMSAMEEATLPEAEGGGRKYTDDQIEAWVSAWCENRVKVRDGTKKKDRKADDRSGLIAELLNYVLNDEDPTCEKETVVRKTVIFSTDMFSVRVGVDTLDKKLARWKAKLAKAAEKAAKAKVGSRAREKAAEVERTVVGERRQWVQGAMRLLPKVTVDNKGAWDLHGDKLHDAIFEGKGLKERK